MEQKKIIAGNWKMNGDLNHARAFAEQLRGDLKKKSLDAVEFMLFPTSLVLVPMMEFLKGTAVRVGCQNVHFEKEGAFTGEIAATQLKAIGCRACLVGHSERRHVFGESDAATSKKVTALLACGITPVLCVGETLAERESEKTFHILERQLLIGLEGVDLNRQSLVLAYEPVWAIGTGKNAVPSQIVEVHTWIRRFLAERRGLDKHTYVPILYGGSVKPSNSREILQCENVDGVLVGGASLKVDDYLAIARAA